MSSANTDTPVLGGTEARAAADAASPGSRHASPLQSVFLARRFTPDVEAAIERFFPDVTRSAHDRPLSADELIEQGRGRECLFVSVTESLPARLFEALAPQLRVVATLSVGHDHIDLQAARRFGVAVFVTPDVLSDACAEVGMMALLNAARRGIEADDLVRSGEWGGWAPTQLLGLGLSGRRLGILGMGRIGRALAARARGFGLAIHYHNRKRLAGDLEGGATYHATAEGLLAVSDVLCLCASGSADLAGFLDRRRIELLPPRAIVVNIGRGDLVDDDALIDALSSGRVFAAGLDVFRGEPKYDPRYAGLHNVALSPHIGSATEATRNAMGMVLLDGIAAFMAGKSSENQLC